MSPSPTTPSSRDLHPRTGARFVFDLDASAPEDAPRYAVTIYLPEARAARASLAWVDGQPTLEPEVEVHEAPSWARDEALKLARVLRRTPRAHMVRWRGGPDC